MSTVTALQLPIDWQTLGWPETPKLGDVVLTNGDPKWAWSPAAPAFEIHTTEVSDSVAVEGFTIDHIVLLVPHLPTAVGRFHTIGLDTRLSMDVGGRPAAFFRAGPVIEVVESPVRQASIYGIAITATEPLEALALRWRAMDLSVGEIKEAIQPGRMIMTLHDMDAGFAVMSPDVASTRRK